MADIINMKVIGVGGAGNSVVSRMKASGVEGVSYCCVNTDASALELAEVGIILSASREIANK